MKKKAIYTKEDGKFNASQRSFRIPKKPQLLLKRHKVTFEISVH